MNEHKFAEYWAQAQFCYFKAEAAKDSALSNLGDVYRAAQRKSPPWGPNINPDPLGQSTACADLQRFAWECSQGGWRSGPCIEVLNMLNGCGDMTIINPGEGGGSLFCQDQFIDPELIARKFSEACGTLVSRPEPGQDPCDARPPGPFRLGVFTRKGCDPTIALFEGPICPTATPPPMAGKARFCPEVSPWVPPLPCEDPAPPRPV